MGGAAAGSPSAMTALLRAAPQCVPFDVRLELFRQVLREDKARGRWDATPAEGGPRPLRLTIRRERLLEDAFAALAGRGEALKGRLYVSFVNASGAAEAGLDHGGLTKELLEATVAAALQPGYGLFEVAEGSGLVYPSPTAEAVPAGLGLLEFTGLLVGKALYEGILLDLALAPPLVLLLQGGRPGVDDLAAVDASLAAGLEAVRGYGGDVSDLGLTFSVDTQALGRTASVDLLPGGSSLAVTNANRTLYCHLLADFHLNRRLGRPAAAFAAGMSRVLPLAALRLFSPAEFNQLLSGGAGGGVDVDDLRAHTVYSNGYTEGSRAVRLFWEVVAEFTPEQRSQLLRFVTSCGRAPLGGFQHLTPPFTVHRVDVGPRNPLAGLVGRDVQLLPSASTCFCMLKLPSYATKRGLRDKLLYAITAGAGFELS
ncbi:MAG: hypothetical protein J3K34DRAFT_419724 [Monoraphidium minutum]|nr:MAG: hypothetical protein J3K34DRAFT_419724 [Monoraphidium minutum]